jgi:hypothetical protein
MAGLTLHNLEPHRVSYLVIDYEVLYERPKGMALAK